MAEQRSGLLKAFHLIKTSVGATWALRQMRELVRLGVDVHAVMPDGPLVSAYEQLGVTVHKGQTALPMRRPDQWRSLFSSFRELVGNVQPDIIHSHFVATTLTMRLALGKNHPIPRVFQVPGPLHLEHPVFRRGELVTAGDADYWIGSCEWTCNRYRAFGISPDRIALAYYGADVDTFTPREPGTLRPALGIEAGIPIVGMVAYMYPPKRFLGQKRGLKGHEDLIDALAIVKRSIPDVRGVFIGGTWGDAKEYEAQVREYGRERLGDAAHFMGTQPNIPQLYADLDIVVHPSHSENVGGAGESLLLRVPTIATNVGGFPDLVKPGETGWLVPPCRPTDLAEAIIDALEHPEKSQRLARNGQRHARRVMDVRKNASDVLAAYEQFLALHAR